MQLRIGHGYDAHPLIINRPLVLGGVHIPWDKGLDGHSDADVLLHAIMDAFLGALALGDIGAMFPDDNMIYKNADSLLLFQKVWQHVSNAGWQLSNLDCTIIAQNPKLNPFIPQMRIKIANSCAASLDSISIKATTEEHMGFTGSEQGICAHAVCLLYHI